MKKRPAKAERHHSFHSSCTPFLSEAAAILFICEGFFISCSLYLSVQVMEIPLLLVDFSYPK